MPTSARPPEPPPVTAAPAPGERAAEAAAGVSTAALLTVHEGGKVRFFDPLLVTRFRADDKYTAFLFDGEEHLLRESLSTLEERLAPFGFVRVHRAELVRANAVRALTPDAGGALLHLSDGQTVTVSRRSLPALKQLLGLR
ncbi:LytR/AlgR family response regulator transcription factor [Sorangium sp. So ce426]|uniref:LytR/AlgR family response regulator transcription factor n=1 Tax=Sorangium sp. So ce426 TaxID=3133312 RepID=UPI003F5BF80B